MTVLSPFAMPRAGCHGHVPSHCSQRARSARRRLGAVYLLLWALGACASAAGGAPSSQVCPAPERTTRHELLFGLDRPNGPQITPAEFKAFVDEVVTPLFEQGLTIIDASGQWRYATGQIVSEPSRVIVLLHPDDAETRRSIGSIITEYRRRFQQESVGWVRSEALVCF
jgi:hypothetical protein